MKYTIIVEKDKTGIFVAYCPNVSNFRACGKSMGSALVKLQQSILCFLHDPQQEFDIVVKQSGDTPILDSKDLGFEKRD